MYPKKFLKKEKYFFRYNNNLTVFFVFLEGGAAFGTTIPKTSSLNKGAITNNNDTLSCKGNVETLRENFDSR
jgi:hypothetical protein